MGVPVDAHIREALVGPEYGHERNAGLDQPAGLQHRLAVGVPAVTIAKARVFAREVEGFDRLAVGQQVVGAACSGRESAWISAAASSCRAWSSTESQQPAAIVEPSEGQTVGQAEFADPVIGLAGILVDREGGKGRSHPARALAVALLDESGSTVGNLGPHLDVGGQGGALLPAPEMGQHGPVVGPVFTEFTAAGPRDRPAGQQLVRGGRVVHVGVMHRADDRQAIEPAGRGAENVRKC